MRIFRLTWTSLALAALATVAGTARPALAGGHHRHAHGHAAHESGRHRTHASGGEVRVSDHGSLSYHSDTARAIIDTGRVHGTIPGWARVRFDYNGSPRVTATFAIHARGGTLYGKAHCALHDPTSRTPSFAGRLTITGGRGRYAHARGGGEMFGVFHRRGYGLVVHANGNLRL